MPTYELPRIAGGIDLGGLYELAGPAARAGTGMTHPDGPPRPARPASARVGRPSPAGGPLDVDALLDDPRPGSSCAAAPAASARRRRPPRSALRAAERGRKVVVLTIDPARRLAQSMGIEALDNTPRPVHGTSAGDGGASTR